jgi:hypothetical protein
LSRYNKAVQEEIQALSTTSVIGWIKIDAKPIKQAGAYTRPLFSST